VSREVCCSDELLQSFVEGTLAAREAQVVKAHVAACRSCRIAVSEYKQLMWDLSRPPEVELPAELERSYAALIEAWKKEHRTASKAKSFSFLMPAWAAQSVAWTRKLPAVSAVGSLARRLGNALLERVLPRWMRPQGGGRH